MRSQAATFLFLVLALSFTLVLSSPFRELSGWPFNDDGIVNPPLKYQRDRWGSLFALRSAFISPIFLLLFLSLIFLFALFSASSPLLPSLPSSEPSPTFSLSSHSPSHSATPTTLPLSSFLLFPLPHLAVALNLMEMSRIFINGGSFG